MTVSFPLPSTPSSGDGPACLHHYLYHHSQDHPKQPHHLDLQDWILKALNSNSPTLLTHPCITPIIDYYARACCAGLWYEAPTTGVSMSASTTASCGGSTASVSSDAMMEVDDKEGGGSCNSPAMTDEVIMQPLLPKEVEKLAIG